MYESTFSNASFPHALFSLDEELAASTRSAACPHCGGVLHVANYLRKPRGGPWVLTEEHAIRHSLCCAREGCRRRTLPPSVRFLGRRVYLAAPGELPRAALDRFLGEPSQQRLLAFLRFLADGAG